MNDWMKNGERIISSSKYMVDAFHHHQSDHTLVLQLTIHDLEEADLGKYKCVAANPLGHDEESMYLYGK